MAPALGWFVPFMCLGFVLLAAMWAVAGSLVSRQEDLGSSMGLVMMLVMGPYFAVSFFSDNATVMTVLSYVPFSAAVAMPVRMFAGEAQLWEPLVSLGFLAGTVVLISAAGKPAVLGLAAADRRQGPPVEGVGTRRITGECADSAAQRHYRHSRAAVTTSHAASAHSATAISASREAPSLACTDIPCMVAL